MTQIRDALMEFNQWWSKKQQFAVEFKERDIYGEIQKYLPLRQMISFTGLRRVGKTTLMKKIIDDGIEKGIDPTNIIYFSFDEFKDSDIREIIKEYEKIMEKDFGKDKALLLLDEIQKLDGWEDQLKTIYDLHSKNVKIIISGSESLFIKRKLKETLAGRIFEFKIKQLTFKEFLSFKSFNYHPINLNEKELKVLFSEFTRSFGFPELIGVKDREIIKKYIRENVLEKTIYRDLVFLFRIKDASIIESLINIFMADPGQMADLSELAGELAITRQTLSNYLSYLEESFFLRKLYNFSKNRRKIERKLKKYYPTIVSADLMFKDDEISRSKVFEWLIVNQLDAEFFFRDSYKNEVDIVLSDEKIIPIEIKHGKIDTDGLISFMKKFKINEGHIISKEKEETRKIDGKTIFIIPAYKYLLNEM